MGGGDYGREIVIAWETNESQTIAISRIVKPLISSGIVNILR